MLKNSFCCSFSVLLLQVSYTLVADVLIKPKHIGCWKRKEGLGNMKCLREMQVQPRSHLFKHGVHSVLRLNIQNINNKLCVLENHGISFQNDCKQSVGCVTKEGWLKDQIWRNHKQTHTKWLRGVVNFKQHSINHRQQGHSPLTFIFGKNDRCTKTLRDKQWISSRGEKNNCVFYSHYIFNNKFI